MSLRKILLACLVSIPTLAIALPVHSPRLKPVLKMVDQEAKAKHLRSLGYKVRGGIDKDKSDREESEGRGFPHFASSFTVGGTK